LAYDRFALSLMEAQRVVTRRATTLPVGEVIAGAVVAGFLPRRS
jgi:hypothetical protein